MGNILTPEYANWEKGFEQGIETYIEIIREIDSNETFCFDCDAGFDEDSNECFRCDSKNIEHRDLDISRENLIKRLEEKLNL